MLKMAQSLSLAAAIAWGAAASAHAADEYKVDGSHSSVVYRVKHMNVSNSWGRFNELSGTFSLDDANPAASHLSFEVKAGSIDTGNAKRDQHLKSPDFFNTVQYPTITFQSKSVAPAGQGGYNITGDLTLHGVTKPVTLLVKKTGSGKSPVGKPIVGIESTFTLKRSDYQMNKMVGPIGDDVWVNVSIEAGQP